MREPPTTRCFADKLRLATRLMLDSVVPLSERSPTTTKPAYSGTVYVTALFSFQGMDPYKKDGAMISYAFALTDEREPYHGTDRSRTICTCYSPARSPN